MKYLLTLIIIGTFFPSGKMKGVDHSNEVCDETASIIRKVTLAKIKFEEADYRKDKNMRVYRRRYSALVKIFKQKDKAEARKECLRQMIIKDSISPTDTVVELTYEPPISSTLNECSVLSNSNFLKTMLENLN